MITETIIITFIICITVIVVCFIVGYYSNKECKQQRLSDIRDVLCNFSKSYINIKDFKSEFIGNVNDINNMIETIKDLTY